VTPLWPPMTGTFTAGAIDRSLWISETKVEARTTSNVVTPKSLKWKSIQSKVLLMPTCSLLGIENAMLFQNFGDDGYSRVNRVGDDENESFGASGCDPGCKIPYNPCINLHKKISKSILT